MDAKANQASRFGERLRQLRTAAGLTQVELAERAGMSAKSIAALERGRRQRPHPSTVRALAQALGLSEAERAALAASSGEREMPPALPLEAGKTELVKPVALILSTKLYLPQPSASVVRRSRLHARLERGVGGPLTIIAAPAGFGKTTLLADWIATARQQPGSPLRPGQVAWLSLGAAESDPPSSFDIS